MCLDVRHVANMYADAVVKESPCGSDDLLEHYGLSGIYKIFSNQAPDAYLKGVPGSVDFRRY